MPRITALHMLRSTMKTVSAPARSSFRGSLPHPTQPLCTLRVRRRRRLTQHSLPGGSLGLTWAGLAPADRASFAGAFSHSITSSARASSVGGMSTCWGPHSTTNRKHAFHHQPAPHCDCRSHFLSPPGSRQFWHDLGHISRRISGDRQFKVIVNSKHPPRSARMVSTLNWGTICQCNLQTGRASVTPRRG